MQRGAGGGAFGLRAQRLHRGGGVAGAVDRGTGHEHVCARVRAPLDRVLVDLLVRDGRVVLEERLMNRQAGRVRLVAQGPDGYIYIGNDDGQLLRLRPTQ